MHCPTLCEAKEKARCLSLLKGGTWIVLPALEPLSNSRRFCVRGGWLNVSPTRWRERSVLARYTDGKEQAK
jgi:hypothetical protein